MFLKRERHETNDIVIKKISGCKGKILEILILQETPLQKFLKISLHIFAFQKIPSIFSSKKTYIFLANKGFCIPPPSGHVR